MNIKPSTRAVPNLQIKGKSTKKSGSRSRKKKGDDATDDQAPKRRLFLQDRSVYQINLANHSPEHR
jgi:hypothetical protein